jgi:sugar (pentulose or hexulose) kinase
MLGLLAVGEIAGFDETREWVKAGSRHEPDPANHEIYGQLTSIYRQVYHQLTDAFDQIAAFQNKHASPSQGYHSS